MADKIYKLIFEKDDGTEEEVQFTAPQGPKGEPGKDGYTPVKGVDYFDGLPGADGKTPVKGVDYFDGETGPQGEPGYTPVKGVDYFDGAPGQPGKDGRDGVDGQPGKDGTNGTSVTVSSVSESMASGGSNVVTFSDGKKVTIKNGLNGTNGKDGVDGKDGEDYVLTDADRAEIAERVEGATVVQAPKYVNSTDEMLDPNRVYVIKSTGRMYANMKTTYEEERIGTHYAADIFVDNNFLDGQRLSSSTTEDTFSNDAPGRHLTPKLDLTKEEYAGKTIQIHLDSTGAGVQYGSTGNYTAFIQCRVYDANGNILNPRLFVCDTNIGNSMLSVLNNLSVKYNGINSTTLTIDMPLTYGGVKTVISHLRFCGLGAIADSNIYITYPYMETVTKETWVDVGTYAPALTDEDKAEIAEQAAALVDAELLSVIGSGEVSV